MTVKDYIYCEDCEEYVDFYKYVEIENTCHGACKWRYVTEEELKVCEEDCEDDGCFGEQILGVNY